MRFTSSAVGHIFLLLIVVYFSYRLQVNDHHWIFIDSANLAIHEIGHPIFFLFNHFLGMLGGSLFQILVPLVFFLFFLLIKREYFSAAFLLFWVGNNIINVSVYMGDAKTMLLPLIGSGEHDWNWIFTDLNLLPQTDIISKSFFALGELCLLVSIVWMLIILLKEVFDKGKVKILS